MQKITQLDIAHVTASCMRAPGCGPLTKMSNTARQWRAPIGELAEVAGLEQRFVLDDEHVTATPAEPLVILWHTVTKSRDSFTGWWRGCR